MRWKSKWPTIVMCVWVVLHVTEAEECGNRKFASGIRTKEVGLGGNKRITINGCGFSKDQSQFGNGGNEVRLVSDDGENHLCGKHVDKCTEKQLTCYTPRGLKPDKPYRISLKIDGEQWNDTEICSDCSITAKWEITPTIDLMTQSGPLGQLIQWYGRMFTERYGTNTNISKNNRVETIIRAWAGGKELELKNASSIPDLFYKLSLDNSTTDYGWMAGRPKTNDVGIINVTYILEGKFGGAKEDAGLLRVHRNDGIYMYMMYDVPVRFRSGSEIVGISPSKCGVGCHLRIDGKHFDDESSGYSKPEVYVGGQPCKILSVVQNSHLTCEVPSLPETPPGLYAGGLGVSIDLWLDQGTTSDDDIRKTTAAPAKTVHSSDAHYCSDDSSMDSLRMSGIFVAAVSGPYRFGLNSTKSGSIFLNGTLVATTSGGTWTNSDSTYNIRGDDWNEIVVVARGGEDSCVTARALQYVTKVTPVMSGQSKPEKQAIKLTSQVDLETLTMEFNNFASSVPKSEKQRVCIKRGDLQLHLLGLNTGPVDFDSDTIQTALNELPFLGKDENFTVQSYNETCVDITFNSDRGDFPAFTCGPNCQISVEEIQKGQPDNSKMALMLNGVHSPVFTFTDNNTEFTDALKGALETMFSAICPVMFEDKNAVFLESFETSKHAVTDLPPFCGRQSRKGAWISLFSGKRSVLDLKGNRICFAVNGMDNTDIYVQYVRGRVQADTEDPKPRWRKVQFAAIPSETSSWLYSCLDLMTTIKDHAGNSAYSDFDLLSVVVQQIDKSVPFYADAVQLVGADSAAVIWHTKQLKINGTMSGLRREPAPPNPDKIILIKSVKVESVGTGGKTYKVELEPHDCGHNFAMITAANSKTTTTGSDIITSTLSEGSASITIERTKQASPHIHGQFTLSFDGIQASFEGNMTDANISKRMSEEWSSKMGQRVDVARTRSSTCANMDIRVDMIDVGGDQPQMEVVSQTLKPDSAAVTVETIQDGHLNHEPISPSYMRTSHTTPQVQVVMNSVMSKCGIEDCSFVHDQSVIPQVSSIDKTSGAPGTTVVISGSQFSSVLEESHVFIGDAKCEVLSATTTQLTCKVGSGTAGPAAVKVKVINTGDSTGSVTFTYTADVAEIVPVEDGIGGGNNMTVTGYGFSKDTVVKIGSELICSVIEPVLPNQITCVIPTYVDGQPDGGDYSLQVQVFAHADDLNPMEPRPTFTYKTSVTPVIANVIANFVDDELTSEGGQLIIIQGTNFGTVGHVSLASIEATVESFGDTEITVETPTGLPVEKTILLEVWATRGDTEYMAVKYDDVVRKKRRKKRAGTKISTGKQNMGKIPLRYTSVCPKSGSLYGGTRITIEGKGFGTDEKVVKVWVDETECTVEQVTKTSIVCQIQSTVKTHHINNEGTTILGKYLAFNEKNKIIKVGDVIQWTWTTPSYYSGIVHTIHEVITDGTNLIKPGGIAAPGPPSRNGKFQHKFIKPGLYFFSSGFVDHHQNRFYNMKVDVQPRDVATFANIKVEVGSKQAIFMSTGNSGSCSASSSLKQTCTLASPADGLFAFDPCLTPSVTKRSFTAAFPASMPQFIAYGEDVTFTGDQFTSSQPQPSGFIGQCSCDYKSHGSGEFQCTPSDACFLTIDFTLREVGVQLLPYGFAFVDIEKAVDRQMAPVVTITDFNPKTGSKQGGTLVTIQGHGFSNNYVVEFGGIKANQLSPDSWVYKTPAGSSAITAVALVMKTGGPAAVCQITPCNFVYSTSKTPAVTTASLSGNTVTFTGVNFQSDMTIEIGGKQCTSVTLTGDTKVSCTLSALPASSNIVMMSASFGDACIPSSVSISSSPAVTPPLSPQQGSIHGGTQVTIDGTGFLGATTIAGTDSTCYLDLDSSNTQQLVCTTDAHAAGTVDFHVTSNGVDTASTLAFEFSVAQSPVISFSETEGSEGTVLNIAGTNLGSSSAGVEVWFDDDPDGCDVTNVDLAGGSITCSVGEHASGVYEVRYWTSEMGFSNSVDFDYTFAPDSVNPTSGDVDGGQKVTISGSGFTQHLLVTIGGSTCTQLDVTSTEYICETSAGTGTSVDVLMWEGENQKLAGQYSYVADFGPVVTSIAPARGGTAGGTKVSIVGEHFSGGQLVVTIDGSPCNVVTNDDTHIECTTTAHAGTVLAPVEVTVGSSKTTSSDDFHYVDVWSSRYTWSDGPLPQEGEIVVIDKDVYLDTNTPVLAFLLIQGGRLIFDDTTDVELHAEYILITDGGALQVGTELNPFQHQAVIMMHGHIYSKELPIYGAKVLALRQGTLDMHGQGPTNTWSCLERTVRKGDTEIILQHDITGWNVGDSVVIATTGPGTSESIAQTEVHIIAAVSSAEWKLTLEKPIEYTHFAETETHGGVDIEIRAEVGLLTRNVRFQGSRNQKWNTAIPACEAGFDTGEFVEQTCFQGRFGAETGTDEFGAHILVHPPEPQGPVQKARARIQNVEFTYVGQAFRLGRYPIHYHICGNVSESYVKSNAIHQTFNRMVNIHASHYLLVRGNVGYNVMGGAIFLEDHIETGNIIEYNLLLFVRGSTSLLNQDITPAGVWITHPNNIIRFNIVAGGTHFGYWYFLLLHPAGPSFDESICPYKEIFGVFEFNRAHSLGWFGIWIFPEYFPMQDGSCGDWSNPVVAIIRGFVVYNADKGAESVDVGSVQYIDCVFFQCNKAGYEGKTIKHTYRSDCEQGAMVKDSLFVGRADNSELWVNNGAYTKAAIILPFFDGFFVIGCKFYNFELVFQVTSIDGICGKYCNGFTVNFYHLTFNNVNMLVKHRWEHELVINDATGSLSGTGVPQLLVPCTSTSLPSTCVKATRTDDIKVYDPNNVEGCFCPPDKTSFVRMSWNNVVPASSIGSKAKLVSSDNRITYGPFSDKRITHKDGYMVILMSCATYLLTYETYVIPTNMSWTGKIYNLAAATEVGQCNAIILQFPIAALPHVVSIDNGKTKPERESSIFTLANAIDLLLGAWYYDPDNGVIGILIKAEGDLLFEKKCAGTTTTQFTDVAIDLLVYRCYYKDCKTPLPPSMQPLADGRPEIFQRLQDTDIWGSRIDDRGQTVFETVKDGSSIDTLKDGDDLTIHEMIDEDNEWWVVMDKESIASGPLKRFGTVTIYGVFEIDYLSGGVTFTLEFDFLIIYGRFIGGWPDNPMLSSLIMTIHGTANGPVFPQESGAPVGPKAIAVYGAFDAHGPSVGDPFTQLEETAEAGATKIKVAGDVSSWQAGDAIIVTSTSHDKHELEEGVIASIQAKEITLTQALRYRHMVKIVKPLKPESYERTLAAYVGLKTRRLSIVGKDNGEHFGGRVLVSSAQHNNQSYSGVARVSNVAFWNMGMYGYTESSDLRSALAFNQLGIPHTNRPDPYVVNCSFYDLANTAVSVVGSAQVNVEGSLVYGAVGHGIRTEAATTSLMRNLIANSKARALWQGRFDEKNPDIDAGIYAIGATELFMTDNIVAGSEQAGYTVLESSDSDQCNHNEAIGNLFGWAFFPSYGGLGTRHKICGYTFWLNCYYGIYYQASEDLLVKDNYFEENGVGLFPFIIGPSIRDHIVGDNRVTVESNFFMGSEGLCTNCLGTDEPYKRLSSLAQPKLPGGVKFGMQFTTFSTGPNKAPKKPFSNIMAYNTNAGVTELKGNTFMNFEGTCSVAMGNNPGNDDMNHLVTAESSVVLPSVAEVPVEALTYYTIPNVGKINPSDCVDMDCDGMKKQLLYDSDGSLLGKPATVIPMSEYEWDGDPRRGLGDYRIPNSLLADPITGDPVPVDSFGRYKGIWRSENCEAVAESRHTMYICEEYYSHLVIESLDEDTEDRRLSPVAVVVDNFIDLINGPQDHGWCNGYTCQERISTFHAVLPSGKTADIHFSSTNPDETRFSMLNAAVDNCVLICVFDGSPYRIDIHAYIGNTFTYVKPNNGLYSGDSFSFLPGPPSDFMPTCDSNPDHGSNYINRDLKRVCFILRGNAAVDLRKVDQIMLKFAYPSMTTDEFFRTNLIPNIAALLGLDLGLVRFVDVVAENAIERRRKRSEGGVVVTIEVGPPPTGDSTPIISDEEFAEQLAPKASELMNDCQSGAIADILDTEGLTCDEIAFKQVSYIPAVPSGLRFEQAIESKHEGVPFSTQPRLRAYDSNGNVIGHLGTVEFPWQMTAVHRNGTGHPRAVLSGTVTIQSQNGWFNFTDLAISHAGTGYIIDFYISSPSGQENLTITSDAIGVTGRPLTAGVYSMTSGHILQNSEFTLTLDLRDETTGEVIEDIDWRDHEFDVTCNLTVAMDTWTLGGALSQTFDSRATFSDLTFSGYGLLYIGCKVESTPAEYEFYSYHEAVVVTPGQKALAIDATNFVTLRFNVDYSTYLASKMAEYQLLQAITYKLGLAYSDIIISAAGLSEGSIIVTLTIEGQSVNVTSMTQLLCSDITDGSTVTVGGTTLTFDAYMMVDGSDYYSTCTAGDDDDDKGLHPGFIALIAVGAVLIIGLIILLLVWVFKIRPRSKTHGEKASEGAEDRNSNTRYGGGFYYIDNGRTVFMAGPNNKMANLPEVYRPKSAAPLSTLYDDGGLPIRRSPHPAFKVESVLETDRPVTPSRSPRPPFRLQPMLEADRSRPVTPSDINRAITPTE